ncbi:MAG: 4,5-DOPA dioxygenase extradiol [Flavobacterium sp. BFFFF2]|nr:MAG: 4,5-DOPA dioxygenase extradiol [Flavobacterium sp. BFFFF2]
MDTPIFNPNSWLRTQQNNALTQRLPVLFVGHGSPMNALWDNTFTQQLQLWPAQFEQPQSILVISAHWLSKGTWISTTAHPTTIYDFGGFDERLYQINYGAPGDPARAQALVTKLSEFDALADPQHGFDHGAWTVLKFLYPKANIPVFEMSIDYYQPPSYHYQLAKDIQQLRDKGVLIICSGNIVHNLRNLNFQHVDAAPFDWAVSFDEFIKKQLLDRNDQAMIHYEKMGAIAEIAVPTNDHYLPLIYALGATNPDEKIVFWHEGFQHGSISMRCIQFG